MYVHLCYVYTSYVTQYISLSVSLRSTPTKSPFWPHYMSRLTAYTPNMNL